MFHCYMGSLMYSKKAKSLNADPCGTFMVIHDSNPFTDTNFLCSAIKDSNNLLANLQIHLWPTVSKACVDQNEYHMQSYHHQRLFYCLSQIYKSIWSWIMLLKAKLKGIYVVFIIKFVYPIANNFCNDFEFG